MTSPEESRKGSEPESWLLADFREPQKKTPISRIRQSPDNFRTIFGQFSDNFRTIFGQFCFFKKPTRSSSHFSDIFRTFFGQFSDIFRTILSKKCPKNVQKMSRPVFPKVHVEFKDQTWPGCWSASLALREVSTVLSSTNSSTDVLGRKALNFAASK